VPRRVRRCEVGGPGATGVFKLRAVLVHVRKTHGREVDMNDGHYVTYVLACGATGGEDGFWWRIDDGSVLCMGANSKVDMPRHPNERPYLFLYSPVDARSGRVCQRNRDRRNRER
jgi:hypothetical protein